jgi:hypothetical protein
MRSRMDGWEMETEEPSEIFERLECGALQMVVILGYQRAGYFEQLRPARHYFGDRARKLAVHYIA